MDFKEYSKLRVVLVFSILCFFILTLFFEGLFVLSMYAYLTMAGLFLLNRLIFVFFAWIKPKKYKRQDNPYTVLLPVKNESPEILNKCIEMLVKQKGEKQILIGDDGSDIPIKDIIDDKYKRFVEIIRGEGKGKKEMQLELIKLAKYDIAIQMDSDIILSTENDLNNLTSYFSKSNSIGIINGKIRLLAEKNLTEKLQEFQYLCANEIGRSGMGRFGINPCATGELMAFRLDVFKNFLDEYQNKEHIGQIMKFGEDRFMTNIFLRVGFKSIVAEDVICYTYPKKQFKTLLKQQCLHPDEKILVKINGQIQTIKIVDLVPNAIEGWSKIKNTEVISFNRDTLQLEWKRVTGFLKKSLNGRLKEVLLNNGRKVIATCDHPFLCPTFDGFYEKRAGLLTSKDFLPLINGTPKISLSYQEINGYTIDEDMAYLMGLFLGDGYVDYQSIRFFYGLKEEQFALDTKRILEEKFNLENVKIIKQEDKGIFLVRCYNNKLQYIFNQLGLQGLADTKKIPSYIFNSPDSVKIRLIEGLLNSDGHIRSRIAGKEICYSSISKELTEPLCLLLDLLGVSNSLRKEKEEWLKDKKTKSQVRYIVSISDQESIQRLISRCKYFESDIGYQSQKKSSSFRIIPTKIIDLCRLISSKYDSSKFKIHRYLSRTTATRLCKQKFINQLCQSEINFARPVDIKEKRYKGNVYDIEVEDNHNFLHYSGIFLNNCRWKLSGIRESIRCMKEVSNPYLKLWSLLNFLLPMLFYVLFVNLLIYDLFYLDFLGILLLFSSLIVISTIAELPILIKNPKLIYMVVPFTFYNLFFITPLWFYSALNQTETKWGTR